MEMIQNFDDFLKALLAAGFSMGGGNSDGIYSIITWGWNEEPSYETPVSWHTGDPDTDPWEWRIRVLNERDDIAYSKLFFKKSGFITKEWYPYFLAARRIGADFEDAYADGTISHFAKRIYEVVEAHDALPVDAIKQMAGFSKEDKAGFDRALTELQMRMFITTCGRQPKFSKSGEEYGWPSMMFCTTEKFFNSADAVFEKAASINSEAAEQKIMRQILKLNPNAQKKRIIKFIYAR
ncbi:MAG: hypothetical protein FWB91_09335 [Defluviitaleaceae bacterium]|nr:hypothetical protein [Defluviitaleaceae bacterium]